MKTTITILLVLGFIGVATAYDWGNHRPVKPVVTYPENFSDPDRQGGDTILDATFIASTPYYDTGNTAGFTNDYDVACPDAGSTSPDVVYMLVPPESGYLVVDLCGSGYDTKTYVLDANLAIVACNDDYYNDAVCGFYTSLIMDAHVDAGQTYYIVVDGYNGAYGSYVLGVWGPPGIPCVVDCPADGLPEGEPPLMDDYVDSWNGGCNTPPGYPFQNGTPIVCGVSGWYLSAGSPVRDTDWYLLWPLENTIEVTADAEYATYLFELGPLNCENVGVIQLATAGPCQDAYMTIGGYIPGMPVWFWVGPTVFVPPGTDTMYDYVVWFEGLAAIATEPTTWSMVKALYE